MPSTPISPSPRLVWRSRFEPSSVIESLTCSAPRRSQPTTESNSSITLPQRLARCGRRSPTRTGGRSPGTRRAASGRPPSSISVASSSNERPSVPPAPAVSSSSSGHVSDSASASLITSPARSSASSDVALQRRARVQDHAHGAQLRARVQRDLQRLERLRAQLRVLGGAIEQVDGVDDQRLDDGAVHRLVERVDLLVAVDPRFPGSRALVEDLDRPAAALFPALYGVRRTAGGGDVGADQHRMM